MGSGVQMNADPEFEARAVGAFVQKPGCPDFQRNGCLTRARGGWGNPPPQRVFQPHLAASAHHAHRGGADYYPQHKPSEAVGGLIEDPWRILKCAPGMNAGCRVRASPIRISCARDAMRFTTCAPFRSRRRPSTADSCAANSIRRGVVSRSICAQATPTRPSRRTIAWRSVEERVPGHRRSSSTSRGPAAAPRRSSEARVPRVRLSALLPASRAAVAHERSESFSHWTYAHRGVEWRRDRAFARSDAPDATGRRHWRARPLFAAHLGKTVAAGIDGTPCAPVRPPYPLEAESGYIRIGVKLKCPVGKRLEINVAAFFDVAPAHRHFIYLESESGTRREAILTESSHTLELDLRSPQDHGAPFWEFIEMGIGHIATGIDHLRFSPRPADYCPQCSSSAHHRDRLYDRALIDLVARRFGVGTRQPRRGGIAHWADDCGGSAAGNLIRGEAEGRVAGFGAALLIGSILLVPQSLRPDMPPMLIGATLLLATASVIWRGGLHSDGSLHSDGGLRSGRRPALWIKRPCGGGS